MLSRASWFLLLPLVSTLLLGCEDEEEGARRATVATGGTSAGGGSGGARPAGGGQAGSSAGAAGNPAAGGKSGAGGLGQGGSAGAAGPGGGAGAAGKGGAPGKGGSAGGAGTGASAGASGKGGSAGAAGSGAAGSAGAALPAVGSACVTDATCGDGGTCLRADGTGFLGGGPTHGLCVKDCAKGAGSCGPGTQCLTFGASQYCVESCTFGTPPLPESSTVELPKNKCHGRLDVSCSALGGTTSGVCVPRCWPAQSGTATEYHCPQATTCDPVAGVCVPGDLSSLFETGHACDPKIASRQCLGDCIPLDDQNQQGICVDPCVAAVPGSCGGLDRGLCFLDTSGVVAAGKPVSLGPLDVGGCAESAGPTEDAACYWEGGFFPMSLLFAGEAPRAYCLQARTCDGDASCIEDCKLATDCGHGDAVCTGGKCTVNDTCRDVGSKKYCLDHAPTVP